MHGDSHAFDYVVLQGIPLIVFIPHTVIPKYSHISQNSTSGYGNQTSC